MCFILLVRMARLLAHAMVMILFGDVLISYHG
jgi:hypothetical protein